MGIKFRRFFPIAAIPLCFVSTLLAAPKLRLSTAAVGPVAVAQGSNAPTQTVEAYNAGDGSLSLSLTSSATWLSVSAGSPRNCATRAGTCIPLQLAPNVAALSAGTVTAVVTVSDPNAIDAPQTLTVTVQVGGAAPASVDAYVAPGGTRDIRFTATSALQSTAATQDGSGWLSLALDGAGSFQFPYRIRLAPRSGMADGTYSGTLTVKGSAFAPDNKAIPVTMRVTTKPIAEPTPARLQFRVAQGAPKQTAAVAVGNAGQGSLALTGSAVTTASSAAWLSASVASAAVALVSVDASSLAPGSYSGAVSIASNAANDIVTVPVDLTVLANAAPLIRYQGVVDNGTFGAGDPVARGDVTVVLGEQLSFDPLTVGKAPPLATKIGGARVLVNGAEAPMYYSSYGQLAFQMPMEAPLGPNVVQVERDGQKGNQVSVEVADLAPRLLRIGIEDFGAVVNPDYSIAMPSSYQIGVPVRPARVGETITIYAIGLGPTDPPVPTGAPAPSSEPLARLVKGAVLNFGGGIGGVSATPLFAGLTPTYAGLYQINVTVPAGAPKGNVSVTLAMPGAASNAVRIAVE